MKESNKGLLYHNLLRTIMMAMGLFAVSFAYAQGDQPTFSGKLKMPSQSNVADPIGDVFSRNAVSISHLEERAKHFLHVEGEVMVALELNIAKKDARTYMSNRKWSDIFGGMQVTYEKFVLAHNLPNGKTFVLAGFKLPDGIDVMNVVRSLVGNPHVLWSSPSFYMDGDPREFIPNDPSYNSQYHHPLMNNHLAWDVSTGTGIIMAVTDDGVELSHSDLAQNIWVNTGEIPGDGIDNDGNGFIDDVNGWDFDNSNNNPGPNTIGDYHGTHVAGILGGRMDNEVGIAGVAGTGTIMPIQFYGSGGLTWSATIVAQSFAYAVDNGAHIINTSYNVDGMSSDIVYRTGVQYVHDNNVLYLNSAGNNNELNPARQVVTQALLVASTTSTDQRSNFSNYGIGIDIAAPGSSIYSTVTNNSYATLGGTSMATPNAAGAAALIWSENPGFNAYQVAALLLFNADNIDAQNPTMVGLLGSGRVNTFAALTNSLPAPKVKSVTGIPEHGSGSTNPVTKITVAFDQVMDRIAASASTNYELRNSGPNQIFNDFDDVVIPLTLDAPYYYGSNFIELSFTDMLSCVGKYRFSIVSNGLKNPFATALDGNGDGVAGDNYIHEFYFSDGYYVDADEDGYGTGTKIFGACMPPAGYSAEAGDCDDSNDSINPGATEICNGFDDDCDGYVDVSASDSSVITYANTTPIIIAPSGSASPYPSTITVSGITVPVKTVSVKLKKLNHTWVNDVDILLVGPGGQKFVIFSDVGTSNNDPVNADVLLTDDATMAFTSTTPITSGVFLPSNMDTNDNFPAPCPAGPYSYPAPSGSATFTSLFANQDPNGDWQLFVFDDTGPDGGNINEGWELNITTLTSICTAPPAPVVSISHPTCGMAGSIFVTAPTGAGYTYSIGGAYQTQQLFSNLAAGIYEVTAKDAGNNISPATIVVLNPPVGTVFYEDADGDGFGNALVTTIACSQPTGYVSDNTDCNDADDTVYPGAPEICDGKDNDCDGNVDEDGGATWYLDADEDGFGDANTSTVSCTQPAGYVTNSLDCDDADDTVYPGAPEICDGKDNDCDGDVDEDGGATWYLDADEDGFGDANTSTISCTQPAGYVTNNLDCDDADDTVYPGAPELCDGKDNDCDGDVDEDGGATWYLDADEDGFGDANTSTISCTQPAGYVTNSLDCDDADDTVYPGAPELCDGKDNDCDGDVDEDGGATWYLDADEDGFGDANTSTISCTQPAGYVTNSLDCDDADDTVYPGAPELCDGKDNDCDGTIDDGAGTTVYYQDLDGDGFGNDLIFLTGCSIPAGYVETPGDCDDNDNTVYPGAPELCDGKDNDCDGNVDGPPTLPVITGETNMCSYIGTGADVVFVANSDGANTYQWTVPPTVNIVSGQGTNTLTVNILAGFELLANKQIRVIAHNDCGSSPLYVHYLNARLPMQPGAITGPGNVCHLIGTSTEAVYSVEPVASATGYTWVLPVGATMQQDNGTSVSITFDAGFAGGNISVYSVNECGQSTTARSRLISAAGIPAGQPGIISGSTNACMLMPTPSNPDGIEETYSIQPVAGATEYSWTLPSGALLTGTPTPTSATVRFMAGFTGGEISVVALGTCGSSPARTLAINANLLPGTPGAITATPLAECPARIYRYSVSAYNTSHYHWTVPAGGSIINGQGTPEIEVSYSPDAVSGLVSVTAGNGCGAGKTRTLSVKLTACEPPLPFVFKAHVYPNPTTGSFNVITNGDAKTQLTVRVLDLSGKVIREEKGNPGERFSVGHALETGMYLLQVQQGTHSATLRLIRQ